MPRGVLQTRACSSGSGLGSISRGAAEWASIHRTVLTLTVGYVVMFMLEYDRSAHFAFLSSSQKCQYHVLIND